MVCTIHFVSAPGHANDATTRSALPTFTVADEIGVGQRRVQALIRRHFATSLIYIGVQTTGVVSSGRTQD